MEEKKTVSNKQKAGKATKKGKKKKLPWQATLAIILSVIALLFLLGFTVYHGVLNYYLSKLNIVTEEEEEFVTERLTDEGGDSLFETAEIPYENPEFSKYPVITNSKNTTHILLMATDGRAQGGAGRSDVMMLVSVNKETDKIVLCSFLRDIWALYPKAPQNPINGGYDKLNHAHAYGGAALTMAVLRETFHVNVTNYVKVDFSDFVKVVDAMGGVDLYLTKDEAAFINRNMKENLSVSHNKDYKVENLPLKDGTHHLNGVQTLAHARNRSIGSDWARTQRQRTILTAMAQKAGTLSLDQLNSLMNVTLPLVTTNMQTKDLKSLISDLPAFLTYDIVSTKIPQEGTYTSVKYNMVTDREKNYFYLYETIYGVKPEVK